MLDKELSSFGYIIKLHSIEGKKTKATSKIIKYHFSVLAWVGWFLMNNVKTFLVSYIYGHNVLRLFDVKT